jgi:uncharacterized protein YbjQ (UPF0145 family)
MKFISNLAKLLLAGAVLSTSSIAQARDSTLHLVFDDAVAKAVASGKIDGSVKFYLAGTGPTGGKVLNDNAITNKKTNGFGKSDEEACTWALFSALITLQNAAKAVGANAVTEIVSYYKRNVYKDSNNYECHAGGFVVGVALKGQLVKI